MRENSSEGRGVRKRFWVGAACVELLGQGTRISWPDGTAVVGQPHETESYKETARKHGYGDDVSLLCIEHEVMHVALAHWLGFPSQVMDMQRGQQSSIHLQELEENAVLAIQAYMRAIGVAAVSLFCPPPFDPEAEYDRPL